MVLNETKRWSDFRSHLLQCRPHVVCQHLGSRCCYNFHVVIGKRFCQIIGWHSHHRSSLPHLIYSESATSITEPLVNLITISFLRNHRNILWKYSNRLRLCFTSATYSLHNLSTIDSGVTFWYAPIFQYTWRVYTNGIGMGQVFPFARMGWWNIARVRMLHRL